MAGPGRKFRIVGRPRVDIVDHHRDRRPCGAAFVGAGQDAHPVRLLPRRDILRGARPPQVEEALDPSLVQLKPRRAAVDHAADRRPMALAPGRQPQQMAEAVDAHWMSAPIDFIASTKPGKLVPIISASSTSTGCCAASPSIRKAMAMRWSPRVATLAPPRT